MWVVERMDGPARSSVSQSVFFVAQRNSHLSTHARLVFSRHRPSLDVPTMTGVCAANATLSEGALICINHL